MDRETFDGHSGGHDGYASPFSCMDVSALTILLIFNRAAMLGFLGCLNKNLST